MYILRKSFLATLGVLALFQVPVQAEEYDGVLRVNSVLNRSEVHAQAIAAAHSPNQNPDAASSVVATAPAFSRERSQVQAEARAHAHRPNQNLRVEAFVNSRIPASHGGAAKSTAAQAVAPEGSTR